jgi:hypothetical protein
MVKMVGEKGEVAGRALRRRGRFVEDEMRRAVEKGAGGSRGLRGVATSRRNVGSTGYFGAGSQPPTFDLFVPFACSRPARLATII